MGVLCGAERIQSNTLAGFMLSGEDCHLFAVWTRESLQASWFNSEQEHGMKQT